MLRAPEVEDAASHVERYHAKTREVLRAVDLFVAPSQFLAREFERYGVTRERILYCDNGIDTSRFSDCPHKSAPAIVRFGFLGSWMPSKGLHLLVDAFRGLTENVRLIVFGGAPAGDPGEYARGILASAADRRITFPGRIEPRDVASAFRAMDVLVVPSLWFENAPLTIREAFASHTPVVASGCGGMAESRAPRDRRFALRSRKRRRPEGRRSAGSPASRSSLPTLSRQTPSVKTIAQQAAELDASYQRLMRRQTWLPDDSHADTASHP